MQTISIFSSLPPPGGDAGDVIAGADFTPMAWMHDPIKFEGVASGVNDLCRRLSAEHYLQRMQDREPRTSYGLLY